LEVGHVDDRVRRLAENERLFREVNEHIQEAAARQGVGDQMYEFLCECSRLDCGAPIEMTLDAYERARVDPTVFIIAVGHELPEIEEVILRERGYQLVRKFGEAARIVREEDPGAR
jgi:hypothetical protein